MSRPPRREELRDRIHWDADNGTIRVDGRRKILFDVQAMAALRKELVATIGLERSRGVFRRFGFSCGKAEFAQCAQANEGMPPDELLQLGLREHMLIGHVRAELTKTRLDAARRTLYAEGIWRNSYEAERHHPEDPESGRTVCWTLQGFAAGWASSLIGRPVIVLETSCVASGAEFCAFVLRTPETTTDADRAFLDDLSGVDLENHIESLEQMATDLRATQAKLRSSEAKYRALFENAPDMMMLCDPVTGRILDANRAVSTRLGYNKEAVLGMRLRDCHPQKNQAVLARVVGPSITQPVGNSAMTLTDAGGNVLQVEAAFSLVPFAGSTVLQAIYHDVTGFQTAQVALREAEELAHIGRMASAVAHEIRNPLSAIVSGIRLLTSSQRSEEERSLIFDTILVESERLDNTLSDFLQFARPRSPRRKPENIEEMLNDLVRIIWSDKEAVGAVTASIQVDPGLPRVNCDGDQIRQVLWNVILNAVQAMSGTGVLSLSATRVDGHVSVSVGDTGPGIPQEELAKVFEPFHTTKPRGTGLGLPIARSIVQAHGGTIAVASSVGEGTTVTFTLPREGSDGAPQNPARR